MRLSAKELAFDNSKDEQIQARILKEEKTFLDQVGTIMNQNDVLKKIKRVKNKLEFEQSRFDPKVQRPKHPKSMTDKTLQHMLH